VLSDVWKIGCVVRLWAVACVTLQGGPPKLAYFCTP